MLFAGDVQEIRECPFCHLRIKLIDILLILKDADFMHQNIRCETRQLQMSQSRLKDEILVFQLALISYALPNTIILVA